MARFPSPAVQTSDSPGGHWCLHKSLSRFFTLAPLSPEFDASGACVEFGGEGLGVVWRTEDTLESMGKILELKKVATFYVVKHSAKLHSCWKS